MKIDDEVKLKNIHEESTLLSAIANRLRQSFPNLIQDQLTTERASLYATNLLLWNVEDELREMERQQSFDARFVELARKVYRYNDKRSEIKRQINILCGSRIVEEKSYAPY
jgi:hypothetical protein